MVYLVRVVNLVLLNLAGKFFFLKNTRYCTFIYVSLNLLNIVAIFPYEDILLKR